VSEALIVAVDPDVAGIVRPVSWVAGGVHVIDAHEPLHRAIAAACDTMRMRAEPPSTLSDTRSMYKRLGIDPTKTRPSSEALWRRIRRGDPFPRVNSLVDIINWTSLETQLSFGLYDADRIRGAVVLRRGREDEAYAGIRKDTVHVAGRLALVDDEGPFGNPTSDSARTMVTSTATRVLVVIYAPAGLAAGVADRARRLTTERLNEFGTLQ
jgi:DNA/RNA-binding domain of Phe-tRNA-synthetase-like protein